MAAGFLRRMESSSIDSYDCRTLKWIVPLNAQSKRLLFQRVFARLLSRVEVRHEQYEELSLIHI